MSLRCYKKAPNQTFENPLPLFHTMNYELNLICRFLCYFEWMKTFSFKKCGSLSSVDYVWFIIANLVWKVYYNIDSTKRCTRSSIEEALENWQQWDCEHRTERKRTKKLYSTHADNKLEETVACKRFRWVLTSFTSDVDIGGDDAMVENISASVAAKKLKTTRSDWW